MGHVRQPNIVPGGRKDVFSSPEFGKDVIEKLNGIGLRTKVFY